MPKIIYGSKHMYVAVASISYEDFMTKHYTKTEWKRKYFQP